VSPGFVQGAAAAVLAGALLTAGLGCAPAERRVGPAVTSAPLVAAATSAAPVAAPEGMVHVPGGVVRVGAEDGAHDERPVFAARVAPFFLDRHPVTVLQFRRFVAATRHVTDAERLGDGGVMGPDTGGWTLVPGASWHHPLGPDGHPAPDDHPVTQVSWQDAAAYARWTGRRLPTEVEWEHAARGATDARARYAWGDRLVEGGRHMANTGQRAAGGPAHQHPSAEDGHLMTSPVGAYGATPLGLTDMGGNVWEGTASWYRAYADRDRPFVPTPTSERVQRGGSFLCSTDVCHGFRVSARSHATPETALFHVGFRTAADASALTHR
jgi:sulfatase modifying factor 1